MAAQPLKYRAFLSYSHRDSAAAKQLHARLEGFRIDKDLVGAETAMGIVPKQLRPIFRDRQDFDAGGKLREQTIAALDAAGGMILLASPASANSKPVDAEVRLFRERHPDRPLIPVILDGTPNASQTSDPERECFPPALRELDGVLAADIRESGDGVQLALAKVIARLLGLPPDEVFRRAEREQRRRARIRHAVMGALAVLAAAATGSALYAWQELKTNEAFLDATLETATGIVDTAVQQAEEYNVPRSATIALLTQAEGLFDGMAKYGRPTPELRYRKAWMLIQFARNYAIVGDTAKEQARAIEAGQLLAGLAQEKPQDPDYQDSLAAADDEIGKVLVERGNLPDALEAYRGGLAIRERLAAADRDNILLQYNLSLSYQAVGTVLVAQDNLNDALQSYRDSLAIDERLARAYPGIAIWQSALSVAYNKIGEVLVAQGNLPDALQSYRDSLAIRQRLADADPGNAPLQRDLSVSGEKIGDVLVAQGNLPDALQSYRDSLAIHERLAARDPSNAGWQRDLSISQIKVGDILVTQGNLPDALQSYRDSLAIRERLANTDPENAVWQNDLAVSYSRVGGVLVAQHNLPDALQSYQDSLAIIERLAASDPSNTNWQYNLNVGHQRIGDVQMAQGDFTSALTSYRATRDVIERLVKGDPGNSQWQLGLSISDDKLGTALVAQGNIAGALQSYRDSLAIRERLAGADPSNLDWQQILAVSHAEIASTLLKTDAKAEVREHLAAGRDIMARLAAQRPDRADWKRDLAWFDQLLAALDAGSVPGAKQ